MTVDELVETLRMRRLAERVPQDVVAAKIGVPKATLCRWEAGRVQPDVERLGMWAAALNVEMPDDVQPSNPAAFAERLRLERLRRRIEQRDIAAKCGVAPLAVGQWESGRQLPSNERLERWAEVLGVPLPEGARREGPGTRRVTARCGTPSGRRRHIDRGEPTCGACRTAR